MGTRFLGSVEAATHEVYRRSLIRAGGEDAIHTTCFDGGWPSAAHRALRNSTMDRWLAAGSPLAPNRPGEGDVVAVDSQGEPHVRYEDLVPLPDMAGDLEEMAMYAGQNVALLNEVLPAGQIVRTMADEARRILHWD